MHNLHSCWQKVAASFSKNPVSCIWISFIFGYILLVNGFSCLRWTGGTDIARSLNQIEAQLDDNVILCPKDVCDSVCDPSKENLLAMRQCSHNGAIYAPLNDLEVDLVHVHLLVELRRELRGSQELLIDRSRHVCEPLNCWIYLRLSTSN